MDNDYMLYLDRLGIPTTFRNIMKEDSFLDSLVNANTKSINL